MSTAKDHTKSPSEAERDVTEARAELEGSLEELEHRLSPETLMNEAMDYFRGDGRKYVSTMTREARSNPLAVALVGVGLAWLVIGSRRQDQRIPVSRRLPEPQPEMRRDPVMRDDIGSRPVTTPAPVTPHVTPTIAEQGTIRPVGTTTTD